jgi:uncharacterized membrane protein YkoI
MKKKGWIMTIAIASLIVGSGSAIAANAVTSNIGKEKAKEIALKKVPGIITDIELEREQGNLVYEVEITKKDSLDEVYVYIAADSGKVLSTVNDDDDDDDRKAAGKDSTSLSATPSASVASGTKNAITAEQAGKVALTAVKGEVLKVESDWDDGIQQYEVKIKTSEGIVEVDIAAVGGSILSIDYDDDDHDDHDDDDDNDDD